MKTAPPVELSSRKRAEILHHKLVDSVQHGGDIENRSVIDAIVVTAGRSTTPRISCSPGSHAACGCRYGSLLRRPTRNNGELTFRWTRTGACLRSSPRMRFPTAGKRSRVDRPRATGAHLQNSTTAVCRSRPRLLIRRCEVDHQPPSRRPLLRRQYRMWSRPKACPSMMMMSPTLIKTTGRTMRPQRDKASAIRCRRAKKCPATHQIASRTRNTTA